MGKIVQTAGRNTLGEFAPEFAHFNDDVLTLVQIHQVHFFLLSVLFFPFSIYLHSTVIYKDFTHSLISFFVPRFNRLPSVITASGADSCNSFTVLPNPLPPDVAKSTTFLPLKS